MTILSAIVEKLTMLVAAIVTLFGLSHPVPANLGVTTGTSSPTSVSNKTIWGSLTPTGWGITFSSDIRWQVDTANDASGTPSYLTLSGDTSSIIVSKDLRIQATGAAPSSTETKTIAGQSVVVSRYDNPQKGFVYALSFVIPKNGSQYYFLIQSATTSTSVAENFEALVK